MADELDVKAVNRAPIDVLLVEDSEADIKIVLRAFEKGKMKNNIYVVNDGQEALDFIYHRGKYQNKKEFPRPDLILLDIKLPKLDGFQVLEKLKGDTQYNFIPVVMLTSSKQEEDIVRSYRNGAASYMPKPVTFKGFIDTINGFNFYWHIINKLPDGKRGI